MLRAAYGQLAQNPASSPSRPRYPSCRCDDHDFGLNDAGGEFRSSSRAIFEAFWGIGETTLAQIKDGVCTVHVRTN